MDERDGFYFHRSFWESICLMSAKDQLSVFKAITEYGLDGKEPEKLTNNQKASFLLIKPVLAKGRNKAANGKKGGSKKEANRKQTESKTEANGKQTDSVENFASDLLLSDKGLGSNSNELRQGTRDKGVNDSASAPAEGAMFTQFWNAYPESARNRREDAWEAWKQLNPDKQTAVRILNQLEAWKKSSRWMDDNGAFIPQPANFLSEKRGYLTASQPPARSQKQSCPKGASGELGAAEMDAIRQLFDGK